jgi:threonine dehydratase
VVTAEDVERAASAVEGYARETPVLPAKRLARQLGGELWLKLENLQVTGSFKVRGAVNRLGALSGEERKLGVVAASAGNHAQAVAWAAREAGLDALVVSWATADELKMEATRGYGATVDQAAADPTSAFARLDELRRASGRTLVHPFNDAAVIAGQGTVALEIFEDRPVPDVMLVPVGGGGLVSGIAVAMKARRPDARVIAVEPELSPALHEALKAGRSVPVTPRSAADALSGPFAGESCVEICRALGVESVLVTEEDLKEGFRWLYTRAKLACELGAAAATAALLSGKVKVEAGQNVVSVVSGGNVAPKQAAAILAS